MCTLWCLQCKNCVIHTWALERWASDNGALYKAYVYLYKQTDRQTDRPYWRLTPAMTVSRRDWTDDKQSDDKSTSPDWATSSTGLPCSCDMKPMTEKMTNPENMLVPLLMHDIINASLTIHNNRTIFGHLAKFYLRSVNLRIGRHEARRLRDINCQKCIQIFKAQRPQFL